MAWDFETEPEFQRELDWMDEFVRDQIEPLDHVLTEGYEVASPRAKALLTPLKNQVKERGLWACHLGPELGGEGFGQLKLALMNEILGRSRYAPLVFGCQAPDTGNALLFIGGLSLVAYVPWVFLARAGSLDIGVRFEQFGLLLLSQDLFVL